MDKHDRRVMIKDLKTLGLHHELLDNLSDSVISRLFSMIGWAASSPTRDDKFGLLCEHKEVVQGENFYGLGDNDYTTYYYCEDCGEEIEDD